MAAAPNPPDTYCFDCFRYYFFLFAFRRRIAAPQYSRLPASGT